jgi:hypothetical protein
MNWLDRARREICKSGVRDTANTAERTLTAVTAVPQSIISSEIAVSNGSNGSAPQKEFGERVPEFARPNNPRSLH